MTASELAEWARLSVSTAEQLFGRMEFEDAAREALHALVDDRSVRRRHAAAVWLLQRALAVEMSRERNRKGDLPAALGLVRRGAKGTYNKHQAIILMIDMLQDHCQPDPASGDVCQPYLDLRAAAEAVVEGFYEAGIDRTLTAANVATIYRRSRPHRNR